MGFQVRAIKIGEVDGFLACFQAAFDVDNSSLTVVRNSLVNDPYFQPERVLVGVLDGNIISHAVVLHRPVYVGEQVVMSAGISAVGTHPAYQRRGFATRVMHEVMRMLRQREYQLAILTTRVPDFYRRFGFRDVPKINGYQCPTSALARLSVENEWTQQKLNYDEQWPAISSVYREYSQGRTGMQVRDQRYWETWPRRGTFPYGFSAGIDSGGLVALAGDQMVAYMGSYNPREDRALVVSELAHLNGYEQAVLGLLHTSARRFLALGAERTILHVSGNAPILGFLRAYQVPLELETGPGLMVCFPDQRWIHGVGFRNAKDALERLFRSNPPILWHRDGY